MIKNLLDRIKQLLRKADVETFVAQLNESLSAYSAPNPASPTMMHQCNYVEVYMLSKVKRVSKHTQLTQADRRRLFKSLEHPELSVENYPIFVDQENALNYGRFLSDHLVYKAYVPEKSILGDPSSLSLKRGAVSRENVHGCFRSLLGNTEYVPNPGFSLNL